MNKDKHVLPDMEDTLSNILKREARDAKARKRKKTIYGPDNEPLTSVDIEVGRE
ncbi:MAG: hypothetical protein ACOYWZ_07955 [Bacillota bacterium]